MYLNRRYGGNRNAIHRINRGRHFHRQTSFDFVSLYRNFKFYSKKTGNLYHRASTWIKYRRFPGRKATWPSPEAGLPFELLKKHDMSLTIESFGKLQPPIGMTYFLKEIGWHSTKYEGCEDVVYNATISRIVDPIKDQLPGYDKWTCTSSKPEQILDLVLNKIDCAPKENHAHHRRLYQCYIAIAHHLRAKGATIRKLEYKELIDSVNLDSSLGKLEQELGYKTVREYLEHPEHCQPRIDKFKQSLRNGRPIDGCYNSHVKREKKSKKMGRLIWSLSLTARLYEAIVFADVDNLLKKLSYTVSGMPLTDYGVALGKVMKGDKHAVCDDVSGWDTRVGYTLLCMEANFLRLLTDDEEHMQEIWDLYRLYAFPMVSIIRQYGDETQKVYYQLQGQVASGRRVTYSMNTITNIVVTMCRAAFSQGIPEAGMYQWARMRLEEGHSDRYGGKISGDDSVIIMSPDNIKMYATKGGKFMNEIGMPRKGLKPEEDSIICRDMKEISFCSHNYTFVRFSRTIERYMPVRPITEIMVKASMRVDDDGDEDDVTWARIQGANLLINYHHIPSVRLLAQAILSATPDDILIPERKLYRGQQSREGHLGRKAWIDEADICRSITRIVFGPKSWFPRHFAINTLKDLRDMPEPQRSQYDPLSKTEDAHKRWLIDMRKIIRKHKIKGRNYTDWLGIGIGENVEGWVDSIVDFLSTISSRISAWF